MHTVLTKDPSLVPSTHSGQLTTAHIFRSRDLMLLISTGTFTHVHPHHAEEDTQLKIILESVLSTEE